MGELLLMLLFDMALISPANGVWVEGEGLGAAPFRPIEAGGWLPRAGKADPPGPEGDPIDMPGLHLVAVAAGGHAAVGADGEAQRWNPKVADPSFCPGCCSLRVLVRCQSLSLVLDECWELSYPHEAGG